MRLLHVLQEVQSDRAHRVEHAQAGGQSVVVELHRDRVGDRTVRAAQRWDRYERTEEVMDQESFVHLRTAIWRMLRGEQQPDDKAALTTTGGVR